MKNIKDKDNQTDSALLSATKMPEPSEQSKEFIDESTLFKHVAAIIESRKSRAPHMPTVKSR